MSLCFSCEKMPAKTNGKCAACQAAWMNIVDGVAGRINEGREDAAMALLDRARLRLRAAGAIELANEIDSFITNNR